jgi:hypothetical protein
MRRQPASPFRSECGVVRQAECAEAGGGELRLHAWYLLAGW